MLNLVCRLEFSIPFNLWHHPKAKPTYLRAEQLGLNACCFYIRLDGGAGPSGWHVGMEVHHYPDSLNRLSSLFAKNRGDEAARLLPSLGPTSLSFTTYSEEGT